MKVRAKKARIGERLPERGGREKGGRQTLKIGETAAGSRKNWLSAINDKVTGLKRLKRKKKDNKKLPKKKLAWSRNQCSVEVTSDCLEKGSGKGERWGRRKCLKKEIPLVTGTISGSRVLWGSKSGKKECLKKKECRREEEEYFLYQHLSDQSVGKRVGKGREGASQGKTSRKRQSSTQQTVGEV